MVMVKGEGRIQQTKQAFHTALVVEGVNERTKNNLFVLWAGERTADRIERTGR